MVKEALNNPNNRAEFFDNGWLDDQLWTQAIRANNDLDRRFNSSAQWGDGSVLWGLLKTGLTDGRKEDRPFDASTRAMRYAAINDCRLWGMIIGERTRVRWSFSWHLSIPDP